MTRDEYIQFKAFCRIDGALLALMWIVSFALSIAGIGNSALSLGGLVVALGSLFFAGSRLKKFRDDVRGGVLSFFNCWVYIVLMFFYAAILFAVAQFVYFEFVDDGFLARSISAVLSDPQFSQLFSEYEAVLKQQDPSYSLGDASDALSMIRPIDFALNFFPFNVFAGIVTGLPLAGLMCRSK